LMHPLPNLYKRWQKSPGNFCWPAVNLAVYIVAIQDQNIGVNSCHRRKLFEEL